jgi:hypothetical protein
MCRCCTSSRAVSQTAPQSVRRACLQLLPGHPPPRVGATCFAYCVRPRARSVSAEHRRVGVSGTVRSHHKHGVLRERCPLQARSGAPHQPRSVSGVRRRGAPSRRPLCARNTQSRRRTRAGPFSRWSAAGTAASMSQSICPARPIDAWLCVRWCAPSWCPSWREWRRARLPRAAGARDALTSMRVTRCRPRCLCRLAGVALLAGIGIMALVSLYYMPCASSAAPRSRGPALDDRDLTAQTTPSS